MPRKFRGNSMNLSPQATTQLNSRGPSLPASNSSGMLVRPTAVQAATDKIRLLLAGQPSRSVTPATALLRATDGIKATLESPLIGMDYGGFEPPEPRLNVLKGQ